jgi:hypothetical protein
VTSRRGRARRAARPLLDMEDPEVTTTIDLIDVVAQFVLTEGGR